MIHIKSNDEIERIRECGIISSELFKMLKKHIEPGISTKELDSMAESFIRKRGAIPSFKGYANFPASLCISINEEIIHGIPSNRKLKSGDIVGVDVGIKKYGLISDSAHSYPVGKISEDLRLLLNRTEEALYRGIANVKNDALINDISGAIEDYVRQFNYGIVTEYCGHGVGYKNHEDPEIPNYRFTKGNRKIKTGMVIAIEPMINLGQGGCYVLNDCWTVVTIDGKFSAHFEHTVAVTDNGFDILTINPDERDSILTKFFK